MQRGRKSEETWAKIRGEIVRGTLIGEVAREYGVSVASITMRASRGKWGIRALREKEKGKQMALGEEAAREIELELDEIGAGLRRSNIRTKKAIAEELERILKELKEVGTELGLASRARCLAAVTSVSERLHRWREEPVAEDPRVVPMVNLRLIKTSPAQLQAMAKARGVGDVGVSHVGTVMAEAGAGVLVGAEKSAIAEGEARLKAAIESGRKGHG
jgi:hypothetical protein